MVDGHSLRVVELGMVDVAAGVVEVVAGAGIDVADGADHLGAEKGCCGSE